MFSWDPVFHTINNNQSHSTPHLASSQIPSFETNIKNNGDNLDNKEMSMQTETNKMMSMQTETNKMMSMLTETNKMETNSNKMMSMQNETNKEMSMQNETNKESIKINSSIGRIIDCREMLEHTKEIWLGAAKPLLQSDKVPKHGNLSDEPKRDNEHPSIRDNEYSKKYYKEWMEERQNKSIEYAEQIKKAKQNRPNLDRILAGQLPLGSKYEAGDYEPIGVPIEVYADGISPLVMATHKCFTEHRPLSLRPDDLLLPIVQAVGIYLLSLDQNIVREKYFKKNGQINLIVNRNDFIMGKEDNAWDQVFDQAAAWMGTKNFQI